MDEVKQTKILKKPLKVAVNEIPKVEPLEVSNETNETNEAIEAPKQIQRLTRKGIPDTRGKVGKSAENLAKGRAKLEEVWAEKRKLKEQYEAQALERKLAKEKKLKKQINKQYGVESESEHEEYEPVVEQQLIAKKIINAPKKEVIRVEQREKPIKEKKKVIKYVEVESESEEEEEQIVYVKKQKAQKVYAPVVHQQPMVQQQQQGFPRIQFF